LPIGELAHHTWLPAGALTLIFTRPSPKSAAQEAKRMRGGRTRNGDPLLRLTSTIAALLLATAAPVLACQNTNIVQGPRTILNEDFRFVDDA
jgi:hypothetical protein